MGHWKINKYCDQFFLCIWEILSGRIHRMQLLIYKLSVKVIVSDLDLSTIGNTESLE